MHSKAKKSKVFPTNPRKAYKGGRNRTLKTLKFGDDWKN
jgi:hypothetical protein